MKGKSEISFTSDVIDDVAGRLQIKRELVREVYNSLFDYLYHVTHYTNASSVFIPSIGTLYMKVSYAFRRLGVLNRVAKRRKLNVVEEKQLKIFQKRKARIDKHIQETIDKKKRISRHLQKDRLKIPFYTKGKSISEIARIQNEGE